MAAALLVFLSLLFVVTHIGMTASPVRSKMVSRFGELGYKGIYSLVSIVTLGGAIWFFIGHRQAGPLLWDMPRLFSLLALILMLIALPLMVFGFVQPSPTGMAQISYEPRGILLITRHPVNMGIAFFGLAHMLANPWLGDVALFGSLFIVGSIGAFHQDMRKAKSLGEQFAVFKQKTSVIPLVAVILRKNNFGLKDLNKVILIVCAVIYIGLIIFHNRLFGVSVF